MKLYRGFNADYHQTWGARPGQKYIWTTSEYNYALEYAKEFENGAIVKFDVLEEELNYITDYECSEFFDDEYFDIMEISDEMVQTLIDAGYNAVYWDNSGNDIWLILDKKILRNPKETRLVHGIEGSYINDILRNAGTTYSEKEKKVDEAYQKYKKMYREIHKDLPDDSIAFRESPASYLTMMKNSFILFLDEFDEAVNDTFLIEGRQIPYINRISGFVNINNGKIEIDSENPQRELQKVRFMIYEGATGRNCYISYIDKNDIFEAYKILKEQYSDFYIGDYILDALDETIVIDSNGNQNLVNETKHNNDIHWLKKYLHEDGKDILRNSNIKLNESWTDSYELYDIYENYQPRDVLSAFEYDNHSNIWFPLIKPTEYKKALTEFMKMNELIHFPKDKVFKWLEIIMKNTCILNSMTALAGHTSWFPFDDCIDVYPELEDKKLDFYTFANFLEEKGFYDWCKLPDGSDAWSDYGIEPIMKILDEYNEQMTAEQMLVLVNRCLDVWHHRGDLASAFIEGGSASLTKISNECVQNNKNILTEGKYTVQGITFYENPSINWIKSQLNAGEELRVAIDGDLDEPYFGQWLVWDAYLANHNKAFQILGMFEEDSVNLRLSKDAITYWGYSDNQMSKLSQCEDIQKLYPNGYKLVKEW